MNYDIKEMVTGDKQVTFVEYRSGELWYETENGFQFPVPVSDTGDGVFKPKDKALVFMRWIRKHLDLLKTAKEDMKKLLADLPQKE